MKTVGRIEEQVGTRGTDGVSLIRTVDCVQCGRKGTSSDHWAFGVLDRHTHLAALRQVLAESCAEDGCPHAGVVVATPANRYPQAVAVSCHVDQDGVRGDAGGGGE